MAGKPGMKGGGGARPGAGRKPVVVPPLPSSPVEQTPLDFLLATMRDSSVDARVRLDAAKAAAPFMHAKVGEGGKKEERQKAAGEVSKGKFAAGAPPRLAAVK